MLPPGTSDTVLENIWRQIDPECKKLGITIVGGHTGTYPGIAYPLNGGCTVIGLGSKDQITPACNARIGDRVIITKGPAIEAAAILVYQAEKQKDELKYYHRKNRRYTKCIRPLFPESFFTL